jgi:hypothetical protein
VEAIFGANKQIETIEKIKENIYVSPGIQSDDKIILNNNVRILLFNKNNRDFLMLKIKVKQEEIW